MAWAEVVKWFVEEWKVLKGAPATFVIAIGIMGAAEWEILNFHYNGVITTLQTEVAAKTASAPVQVDASGRHLSSDQRDCLLANLKNVADLAGIGVTEYMDEDSENYGGDFEGVFMRVGLYQPPSYGGVVNYSQNGIMIAVPNIKNIPEKAVEFNKILTGCGLITTYTQETDIYDPRKNGFELFIGPAS